MKIILIASIIIVPVFMLYLTKKSEQFQIILNAAAVISVVIFGVILSTSVYQIIIDDAVFMTAIHAIFLNPFFLLTGSYSGAFIIYRLLKLTIDER
ncbi:transposase [Solibacillus silvestris]|uniref:transposase n=1 Tax=Solibacillus silvestris TaxID=76853 RepID=UPI003F7E4FDC